MSWHTLLVLGGIGSGKSQYAESVLGAQVDGGAVRRVPAADLSQLSVALADAKPDETLLVDGLDQLPPPEAGEATETFAAAVRGCPAARLVLVSAEVGLSTAPSNAANRQRADALGALNRTVAATVDAVVLVVAGQAAWLKGTPARAAAPVAAAPAEPAGTESPDLSDLRVLPMPDEESKTAAARLVALGPVSLGALAEIVGFAAGAQRTATPAAWRQVRVLVLHGDHAGAAAAGAPGSDRRAGELRAGTGPLAQLAAAAGASIQVVAAAAAAAIEDGPATTDEEVETALGYGWRLAELAADEGVDALVIGAIGDGADTAAAAVTAAVAANSEPASLLARVRAVDGTIDDPAWMRRCAAVRDAVHRAKSGSRAAGRAVLAELGGADLAIATGVLLGAAARRTPVLLDGPVGAAAALVARGLAAPSRHWWLLPDHGQHPTVVRVGEVLGLTPVLDLRLELGEGATALAALPLLNSALELAGTLAPPPEAP
jgi:NaMN:DMB phosphoribosyltransferase/adenosyl cobinamide kinase/adenosyl cobinamide phosphate guanylyltransferase